LKLVIFDCDGTLVDSQHMICAAMHNAYGAEGLEVPERERLLSIVGLSLAEAFTVLGADRKEFPIQRMAERYKAAFQVLRSDHGFSEPLYPGAREAIEAIAARAGVSLGMATGKSQRGARGVLTSHGLLPHFATIQTADDAPSKPHPGMVIAAMRDAGAEPANTCVVGDTTYDMEMAAAAGATAIGVSWGYHQAAHLREAGASVVIDHFVQLVPALDRVWGEPAQAQSGSARTASADA
jgi:phosphoglycolate phosphatase